MKEYAIEFRNVSKIYKLVGDKKKFKGKRFYALKSVSFKIKKGEVVGILGTNGSGKSTMATILAGITEVDEGEMVVNGEQALIAINTGLNNQLTGLENIELKGALLGLRPQKVKEIIERVADFSELGEFLYQPVKKYSSGMKSRLGFSINLCLDPDIFIVDEALSVGDKGFANKCLGKMRELKKAEKTIIFVSHSLPQVKEFCDTALWIEDGEVKEYGDVDTVANNYSEYLDYLNTLNAKQRKEENEKNFQNRLIIDGKEGFWDRFLTFFQKER